MAIGPGRYDDTLTRARQSCGATSAVLIVLDGPLGSGFSVQATAEQTMKLPAVLRMVADGIEADLDGKAQSTASQAPVVHILLAGLALCGIGMPSSWPTTDRWVRVEEGEKSDC